MKYILAQSIGAFLFYFGLWPLAILTVLAFWLPQELKEEQRRQDAPIVYPTFEQKQLMAIVAAHEAGQFEKAALLERKFQQEW
ncbi:hypothetical protein N9E28_02385 [Alphaproteobacteria bacterium]|nr:hypothetical protein [Alphaproteobacteria bacterium]